METHLSHERNMSGTKLILVIMVIIISYDNAEWIGENHIHRECIDFSFSSSVCVTCFKFYLFDFSFVVYIVLNNGVQIRVAEFLI
jgi:hypothetical protein